VTAPISAASASSIVEQVGSYAGYAAVLGLGVLALLYFSQAREVKRLREWAGRAPERAAELEQRVQADAQRRVVAQPLTPETVAAKQSAEARTAAATAAVYASVGAQPPGSAPAPAGQLARPATPSPSTATPGAVTAPAPGTLPAASAPATAGASASAGTATATPEPAPAASSTATEAKPDAPPAATAAAAARAAAASRTATAASALGNGTAAQETAESAAARPAPPPPPALPPAPPPVSSAGEENGFGLSRARIGLAVLAAIVAVAVAIVLMVVLTGGDAAPPPNDFGDTPAAQQPGDASAPASGSRSGSTSGSSPLTSAERRATNVAVLNGTTQTGLARAVADKVQENQFTIGSVTNNADQSVPTTFVSYTAGHEQAAFQVARIIGIDRGSVQPADANTTAAADADVVVTVGSDQIE
jgi:LytR cell envelope-related transcriptional attenuator